MDSLQQNRLQLGLAELYCNETGINSLSDNLGQKQQVAAATSSKLEKCEQTLKNYKKEHGRLTREQQLIEKEIRCVGETFLLYSIFLSSSISLRPHRSTHCQAEVLFSDRLQLLLLLLLLQCVVYYNKVKCCRRVVREC